MKHLLRQATPLMLATVIAITAALFVTFRSPVPDPRQWVAPPVLIELYYAPGGFGPPECCWNQLPALVVYADGRVITSGFKERSSTFQRSMRDGHLSQDEVCTLLSAVEADGFFDFAAEDYTQPQVTEMGTVSIIVNGWRSRVFSAYGLTNLVEPPKLWSVDDVVPPALQKTYRRLADFQAPGSVPYVPERIEVMARLLDPPEAGAQWPFPGLPLATLGERILEGEDAAAVYQLLGAETAGTYVEDTRSFRVAVRPILPFEDVGESGFGWPYRRFLDEPQVVLACDPSTVKLTPSP